MQNLSPEIDQAPQSLDGLRTVKAAIAEACGKARRNPGTVTLVAVSKTVPTERIEPIIAAGQSVFGENRVQEARSKWPALKERHPQLELHLLGPLQSNKVREAVALFDVIHSVDRGSLCEAVARECTRQDRWPRLLVQVNTGAEPQKAGVPPGEVDAFLTACRQSFDLEVTGLMCIPPVGQPPAPHFTQLAEIAGRHGLPWLSMGMSGDFALAVGLGATHVRVGTAIFGARS